MVRLGDSPFEGHRSPFQEGGMHSIRQHHKDSKDGRREDLKLSGGKVKGEGTRRDNNSSATPRQIAEKCHGHFTMKRHQTVKRQKGNSNSEDQLKKG